MPKAVNTQTNFKIKGAPIGLLLSFSSSFFIGALQTFVHAVLDPMSGPYFANIGRAITRGSLKLEAISESEPGEFIQFFESLKNELFFLKTALSHLQTDRQSQGIA
mgnify:CR=1 FL=1